MIDAREAMVDILLERHLGGRSAPDLRERILAAEPQAALAVVGGPVVTATRRLPRGRVSGKELTQFTVQLAALMNAGLPIVRSLKILSAQLKPSALKNISAQICEDVETGSALSEAMARHPAAFGPLYTNMVRAGEAGGMLDVILERLAEYLEKAQALKRRVVGAMIYPAVVMTIAVAVVLSIMTFIIPKFADVFRDLNVPLPSLTLLLMDASDFIASWPGVFVLLVLPASLALFAKAWARTRGGAVAVDRAKLAMPLLGAVFRKSTISRFCRTLGTLLQSGVPLLEALKIVRGTVGNEIAAREVDRVHDSVREGDSIAGPLAGSPVFDPIVVNMIDVGEETGQLDRMLLKIADTFDAEVDALVSGLVSIMEPCMIVGLGVTVGFIVVALFMPLATILDQM
jgi:type IV pilus assembly protein PilC